jgi:hypothetical protein
MSDEQKPTKPPKIIWTTLRKPEELAAAKARLVGIKHEFSVVYGLKWTEHNTFSGRRRALVSFEGYHAEAVDHGPLSFWTFEEETIGGTRKRTGSGDSIAYEIAKIEAMEAMVEALDKRAELAAEALKDPEPIGGATGPQGAWGATTAPAPTMSMATSIAGPVAIWGASAAASMWPGPTGPVGGTPAAPVEDDEDDEDDDKP